MGAGHGAELPDTATTHLVRLLRGGFLDDGDKTHGGKFASDSSLQVLLRWPRSSRIETLAPLQQVGIGSIDSARNVGADLRD